MNSPSAHAPRCFSCSFGDGARRLAEYKVDLASCVGLIPEADLPSVPEVMFLHTDCADFARANGVTLVRAAGTTFCPGCGESVVNGHHNLSSVCPAR